MYCPFCGAKISDTARFCRNCGKAMPDPGPKPTSRPTSEAASETAGTSSYNRTSSSTTNNHASAVLDTVKGMSVLERVLVAAAPLVILVSLLAPWLELSQTAAFAASWNGIKPTLTLVDEALALAGHASDPSDFIIVASMVLLVAAMLASDAALALFTHTALTRKKRPARFGMIGFAGLAAVLLIHNLIIVFFPKSYVLGLGFSLGSPSGFSWLALAACAALAGCLIYDTRHEKNLFNR